MILGLFRFFIQSTLAIMLALLFVLKEFVNFSFLLFRQLFKLYAKVMMLPKMKLGIFDNAWKSFGEYFTKVGNTWGVANRLDYFIGVVWTYLYGFILNYVYFKKYGATLWQWLQQFNANNTPQLGQSYVHIVGPTHSLLISMIVIFILNLYCVVPWITLTIRRCRSIGHAGLFFVILAPFGGLIILILGLSIPGSSATKNDDDEDEEDWDFEEGSLDYYGERK